MLPPALPLVLGRKGLSLEGLGHLGDNVEDHTCMLRTNEARTPFAAGDKELPTANVTVEHRERCAGAL